MKMTMQMKMKLKNEKSNDHGNGYISLDANNYSSKGIMDE